MKQPFIIETAMDRIREAVRPYPPAAMFALADEGFQTLFQQVVACIISIRTREEVTGPAARRLFARAATADALAALTAEAIGTLIKPATFYEGKGHQIRAIARRTAEEHGGALPCDRDVILGLAGVGPKCANLALGIACGQPRIAVDIHVHRVTNRWGYVQTRTPEQTMLALEKVLPERFWIEINRLLVPFGKYRCTGDRPHCSTCPVLDMCAQVGVAEHR
jgi:endonuclease-3